MSEHFSLSLKRADLVKVLKDMNVTVPANSTLSDSKLEKRLKQALDALQLVHRVLKEPTFNFDTLQVPPADYTLRKNMARTNLNEAFSEQQNALYQNAFTDLRQTYIGIGSAFDQGIRSIIVQDLKRESFAIMIRIVRVYQVDEHTPLVEVVYGTADKSDSRRAQWLAEQPMTPDGRRLVADFAATDAELKLFARLLNMNAKRASEDYTATVLEACEAGFKRSFLLPIGPLDYKDLAKLNYDFGCPMCGEKATKRCSQCHSVSYCSAECQKAAWSQHEAFCVDLKGGTWISLPFHAKMPLPFPLGNDAVSATINRHNTRMEDVPVQPLPSESTPPPNVHDDKPFLVKIQVGMGEKSFLIYDRQRSMQAYVMKSDQPVWFRKVLGEMRGPRAGYGGLKMYRWARRSADFELIVCLDRPPKEQIVW